MRYPHARNAAGSATTTLAAALLLLAACAEDADEAPAQTVSDSVLFMACAESRGSLLDLDAMLSGSKPVNTSSLEHGAGMLGRLADRVSATGKLRTNLARWNAALTAWRDQLRAIEPRIEGGRFVEPDTSALDRALLQELRDVGKPLADWVSETCEGVQL